MRALTHADILAECTFRKAKKVIPVRIRPFTEADFAIFDGSKRDLEGKPLKADLKRCLCVGVEGELFTCSMRTLREERIAISEPDEEGFRWYRIRSTGPILATDIGYAFTLHSKSSWQSQADGGIVTWNGKDDETCEMRVFKRSIFEKSYAWEED